MRALNDKWLIDKSIAFAASVLAGAKLDPDLTERLERATHVIGTNVLSETVGFLADSTLALLEKVPGDYEDPDDELLPKALPLSNVLVAVRSEIELRTTKAKRLPEILIAHAVYLLKQAHLSARDFLKWLKRQKESETRDIGIILNSLDSDEPSWAEIDNLLGLSRDALRQTRDRVDDVDRLYDVLMRTAGPDLDMLWWLKICLALRSSLYCWPIMVAGTPNKSLHGISLPLGLFLSPDENPTVYFWIVNPGDVVEHRPYVPPKGDVWAHMQDSNLQWNNDWGNAFKVGLRVAKQLWRTQNGRLRFVEEAAASAMLNASLVVDMGAACAIVDSVFGGLGGAPYRLTGRSAEAYWVQVVLGMMLPGSEIPLGVVTGRVQLSDGGYEIHYVEGISKKLEYANNAGFSRVVLPSVDLGEFDDGSSDTEALNDLENSDASVEALLWQGESPETKADRIVRAAVGTTGDDTDRSEPRILEGEVQAFLRSLGESNAHKRIEINFCRNVRNVADAMQMSGWRRTAFVRLPATQRAFSVHLHRLFLLAGC